MRIRTKCVAQGVLPVVLFASAAFAGGGDLAERFRQLSREHGLSQSTVLAIHEDARGHLWFGTEDGLNRFDGRALEVFRHDPADPLSLPADYVRAIAEDRHGRLWLGTEGGGLARLDPETETFKRFRRDGSSQPRLASDYVISVLVARDGMVWAGLRDRGLHRLDPVSGELLHFRHDPADRQSLRHDRVTALAEARNGALWVGTARGVDLFEPTSRSFLHVPGGQSVEALQEDRSGALWIGTRERGLERYDPLTGELERFRHDPTDPASLADDRVRAITEDARGRVWVATLSGLDRFKRGRRGFAHFGGGLARATSADIGVLSLHDGRGGALWLGTRHAGLVRWDGKRASFARRAERPEKAAQTATGRIVTSFAEDARGRLFVGTFGDGLLRIDRASGKVHRFRHLSRISTSLSDDRVMTLLTDREGRLWVGTKSGGLGRLATGERSFRNYRHREGDASSLAADAIMSLFEDAEGSIWVGTFGAGLSRFDPESDAFESFRVAGDRVTAMADAEHGLLWVATDGAGLNLLDPATGSFRAFRHDPDDATSLPSDTVLALHRESSGVLWLGTRGGGLARMETAPGSLSEPTFTSFGVTDGLPNAVVYAIRPDSAGALWLSTNHGLARFDPATRTARAFDKSHGLHGNEFNFGAAYASSTGELFFGGVSGFDAFDPQVLARNGRFGGSSEALRALDRAAQARTRARVRTTRSKRLAADPVPVRAALSVATRP